MDGAENRFTEIPLNKKIPLAKRHEKLIRSANELLMEQGNLAFVEQFFSTNYVVHAANKVYKGHDFIRKWVKQLRAAILDLRVVDVAFLLSKGDKIVWQRALSGTHKKSLRGIPASERRVKWTEMMVTRVDGDKIAEEWSVSDLAGQLMLKLPRK